MLRGIGGKAAVFAGAAVLLLAVVVGSYLAATALLSRGRGEAASQEKRPQLVRVGEFVTNLADTERRRFIQVEVQVQTSDPAVAAEVQADVVSIKDAILGALRSRTYAEISGQDGMSSLKAEILALLNSMLSSGTVEEVYFTDFIVQ